MKKVFTMIAAAALSLSCLCALGGCSEKVTEEGNKVVSNAQSYLQSEVGGDVSSLKSQAEKAIRDELGLNNTANEDIKGVWATEKPTVGNDWQWTFDGSNHCSLSSEANDSAANGTYSVDRDAKTVTIQLNTWNEPVVFTYKLTSTLSDQKLSLSSDTQGYKLILQK